MNANINLLIRTDEESSRRKKRIKLLNLIAIFSLVGVGLISLGIFILIKINDPLSIKKQQDDVLAQMSTFQDRQVKLFVLNNRVENIDKVLKIRKDLSNGMKSLLAKIPANLSVETFEMDNKSLVITGQSKSLFTIGEFMNNLTDMVRNKEVIKSLTLNSLTMDNSVNTYSVSIKSDL